MQLNKMIRKNAKTIIKHITQSRFATFANCYFKLPQSYSFFIVGAHGVGLHSLLYYISLCKTKYSKNVYPMPIHILSRRFDLFGHFTSLRFYSKMYPIISQGQIGQWGITFDNKIPGGERWVKTNLTKKAPAIIIVRDPILTLTSVVNHEIFTKLHSNLPIHIDQIYMYALEHIEASFSLKKNMQYLNNKISKYCFVDCSDLMGEKTYPTMQKIAEFLDLSISFSESFLCSINSPIQRYFANPIIYQDQELYLSSFPHFFRIMSYPHYTCPNYCNDLGYTYQQPYKSNILPKETLFLFSKEKIVLTSELQTILENYLNGYKSIIEEYEKLKTNSQTIIKLIQKHNHIEQIQALLRDQVSLIPQEILTKWKVYDEFSKIKG